MRRKKEKKAKKAENQKNKISLRPFQSTQSAIPIADIYKGIVVTDDNRFIKIMELAPIPFTLFSISQKNKVIDAFQTVLMSCPDNVQFSALTLPADLTEQKEILADKLKDETIRPLLRMGEEYKGVLEEHEMTSLRRRFFISFEYNRDYNSRHIPDIESIVESLNEKAYVIASALAKCGNRVIDPAKGTTANEQVEEILYAFLNRNSDVRYEDHKKEILQKYRDYEKENGIDELYVNPLEYISPSSLDFRNRQYIFANNKTYYTFAYIPSYGFNSYVEAGWMTMFINSFSGVDVTIKLERKDTEFLRQSIRNSIRMNKGDLYNAKEDSGQTEDAEDALQGGRYLNEGLRYGADFFYASVMFTITGTSVDDVEEKLDSLRSMCRNQRINLSRYTYQQEDAYRAALPLAIMDHELQKRAKRNMLTDGAASLYPFTTPEFIDPNGLFLGVDETSNTPVIPDIWNRKMGFVNMNIGIFGISGGGKTVTSLTLAARMRMQQIPVVIFACEKEHEYLRITKALGGKFISLATGSKDRINIMDIYPRDESADEEVYGTSGNRSYLEEKVETLIEWAEMKTGKLSPEDRTLLNIAIHDTYARSPYNITSDNNSLYDPSDPEHKRFKKMPIIEDLYNVLMQSEETKRLGVILSYYVHGSGKSFNGHTNVDLSNKFIVFGLEGMSEEDFPAGMHLALDYVWSKVKEDKTKRKAIIFDEFWKVCRSPSAVALAAKMIRLVRAYSTSMVVATQELDDLLKFDGGTLGKTIMSNSRTRFLLQMDEKAAKEVGELLDLTQDQITRIEKEDPGHVLLSVGSTYIKLHIVNSPIERYLMYTDEKTLNEWKFNKERVEWILYGDTEENNNTNAFDELVQKIMAENLNTLSTVRSATPVIDIKDELTDDDHAMSISSEEIHDEQENDVLDVIDYDISVNENDAEIESDIIADDDNYSDDNVIDILTDNDSDISDTVDTIADVIYDPIMDDSTTTENVENNTVFTDSIINTEQDNEVLDIIEDNILSDETNSEYENDIIANENINNNEGVIDILMNEDDETEITDGTDEAIQHVADHLTGDDPSVDVVDDSDILVDDDRKDHVLHDEKTETEIMHDSNGGEIIDIEEDDTFSDEFNVIENLILDDALNDMEISNNKGTSLVLDEGDIIAESDNTDEIDEVIDVFSDDVAEYDDNDELNGTDIFLG